jgi:uncharacterized protein YbjT (DUF2867 family)
MANIAKKPVLVLGGTGNIGRHIVRSLVQKGEPVRVLSRDAARARTLLGEQVEIVAGDLQSSAAVAEAMRGAGALVISVSAFSWKTIRLLKKIERDAVLMALAEAKKAGVPRVVYMSVFDIRTDVLAAKRIRFPIADIKLELEKTLASSAFNWTVFGMPPAMEMYLFMIRHDTMTVPGGGPPALMTIALPDVGEIVAQAVLRADLSGKRLRLAGPEAMSFPEAARRIAAATGRKIRFRKIPLWPIKVAALLTAPFHPYLRYVAAALKLLNNFPPDLVAQAAKDHLLLRETFSYTPVTLELAAQRWQRHSGA